MAEETRKYIVGWVTCRPGMRDAFLDLVRPYAATCRQEPDCLFFEITAGLEDPDRVIVSECFTSGAAHDRHLETGHFRSFWARMPEFCTEGRFENVFAARVVPDGERFESPAA